MSDLVSRFRARVRREMGDAVAPGQRYPVALRRLAVAYWEEARERGESLTEAATALGVRRFTLERWAASEERRFRPVVVAESSAEQPVTVILADGVRVECSSVEGAAALLRALR